ncbi:MAG: RDD family protein, partial [Acidobacteria bacterium]|nr:RDD family protein [Acidobacteriota bacterium]
QIPPSFGFQIGPSTLPMQVAPFGRRLGAGLIDALILAAGFGLFAGIFHLTGHLTGGTVSNTPLNWLIGGSIAALFAAVYFGAFTALRHATPGLLALGLEVRNLDGEPPSPKQSFWRALGYLVSGGSLLLGFIWSLVDEERLTWHDRISETFLVLSEEIEIPKPPPNT